MGSWKIGPDGKAVEIVEEKDVQSMAEETESVPRPEFYQRPNDAFLELMGVSGYTGAPPLDPPKSEPSAPELPSTDEAPTEAPPSLWELVASDLEAGTVPQVDGVNEVLLTAYEDALKLVLRLRALIEERMK